MEKNEGQANNHMNNWKLISGTPKTISRSPLEEKLATEAIATRSLSFTLKNAE